MKRILIGAALGVAAACLVYRLQKKGAFDCVCDNLNVFADKTKRNIKNAVDVGANQAEYIRDRIEYEFRKGKEKLSGDAEQ